MRRARADTRLGLESLRDVVCSLNRLEARLDEIAAGAAAGRFPAAEGPAAVDGGRAVSRGGAGGWRSGWSGEVEKVDRAGSGDSQVRIEGMRGNGNAARAYGSARVCVRLRVCISERTCERASLRAAGAIRAYNQRERFRDGPCRPADGREADSVGRNAAERAGPRHLP
jgi:hypothetical protein